MESAGKRSTLRVHIEGRVQGVGYRFFVQEKAVILGLTGWVRNLPDGAVEALAQGSRKALDEWLKDLRVGPPLSRVTAISTTWGEPASHSEAFEIR